MFESNIKRTFSVHKSETAFQKMFHYFFTIEPDNDSAQEMGNPDQEMSESDEEKLSEMRQQATGAFADGDYEKAAP